MNNLDSMLAALKQTDFTLAAIACAEQLFAEDVELCQRMAEHGAALVQEGEQLLTHCNTGGLATAGVGTALGVISLAHQQGKNIRLWVDETRPAARRQAYRMGMPAAGYSISAYLRQYGGDVNGSRSGRPYICWL